MKQEVDNHNLLIQYLPGKLNGEEHEEKRELVEQYFENDELFEELLNAENDLLDKYVRGELEPDDSAAFAGYLKSLPDGREKAAFAAALVRVAAEKQMRIKAAPMPSAPAEAESNPLSLCQSLLALAQKPALLYTLSIGFGLIAIGISWLVVYSYSLHASNSELKAQLAEKETETADQKREAIELRQQAAAQYERIEQLEKELERQKQSGNAQSQETARPESLTALTASLTLTRATSRALFPPDTLLLSRRTEFVSIAAPIKDNQQYVGYRAVLQTTEGDQILKQEMKQGLPTRLGKAVVFRIAAGQLTKTGYKLTLALMAKDGEEIAQDFYFNVVKQ